MGIKRCDMAFLFAVVFTAIFGISCEAIKPERAEKTVLDKNIKAEIMPVKDVRPGMVGYGLTVYRGVMPEKFFFKVLGVKKMSDDAAVALPVIIAQLTAGPKDFPLEKTGVVAGMSGSPMYINGKLIGALAYGFTLFAKDPICGIQPAEVMLNPRSGVEKTGAMNVFSGKNIPLVLNVPAGMADSFSKTDRFNDDFFKKNFVIQSAAGSSVDAAAKGDLQLQPGSSISASLVRGDVEISSTGTVTMIDGDKIYAFGHPFLGIGETEMPFHQNEVITINSSYLRSSKMAGGNAGSAEGTITNDYHSAISGFIGRMPRTLAVKIRLDGAKGSRTINVEFIKSRSITLRLIYFVLPEIIFGGYKEVASASLGVKQKINTLIEVVFGNQTPPITIEKSFNVSGASAHRAMWSHSDLLRDVMAVIEKKSALSAIAGVNIRIAVAETEEKNDADNIRVDDLKSKDSAVPGKPFAVDLSLSAKRGDKTTKYTITMPVLPIPEDEKLGDGKITVSAGSGFEIADRSDTDRMGIKETVAYFNRLFKPGLFLAVRYSVEKEEDVKEAPKDKAVEFRALGPASVKKIVSSKPKKIIYAVPLPAVLDRQVEFRGVKEKSIVVKKKEEEKTADDAKKDDAKQKDDKKKDDKEKK